MSSQTNRWLRGLTSLVGASLRAGGAGAGGAAAACSLQGSVQVHVGPPQVRVATVTQTQRCLRHDCEQIPTPTFPPVDIGAAHTWPVWGERRPAGRGLARFQESSSWPKPERWRSSSEEPGNTKQQQVLTSVRKQQVKSWHFKTSESLSTKLRAAKAFFNSQNELKKDAKMSRILVCKLQF